MSATEITLGAFSLASLLVLVSYVYQRNRPPPTDQASGYLLNQLRLAAEKDTVNAGKVIELTKLYDDLKRKYDASLVRISELETQVHILTGLIRPGQPGAVPSSGPPLGFEQIIKAGEDIAFRVWLGAHFDAGELKVLAADADLVAPKDDNVQMMAADLFARAKRVGRADILALMALERRPNVERWKA